MSEGFIKELVTLYGPLGLGWVFAVLLFIENRKLVQRLLESHGGLKATADQLASLTNAVMVLIGNPIQIQRPARKRDA